MIMVVPFIQEIIKAWEKCDGLLVKSLFICDGG
jgi:hypothetical protein